MICKKNVIFFTNHNLKNSFNKIKQNKIMDPSKIAFFNSLWNELHTEALQHNPSDVTGINNFINVWSRKIPRFTTGCACAEFWIKWKKSNPFKTPLKPNSPIKILGDSVVLPDFFVWSVDAHNAVNTKLGKKTYSYEEAYTFYKK